MLRLLLENNASLNQSGLDTVARSNGRHGAAVLDTLVKARPDLTITDDTVKGSARNVNSVEMLTHILDNSGLVSERLLLKVVRCCSSIRSRDDVVEKILNRGETIGCNSHQILKVFLRKSECGKNIGLVLDRYRPSAKLSQKIAKWAFQNSIQTDLVVPVVLGYYKGVGVEIEFSHYMLLRAARVFHGPELFRVILGRARNIVITMDKTRQFGSGHPDGYIIMNLLMDHGDCEVKNFERVSIWKFEDVVLSHISTCTKKVSEEMMDAAARWDPATIEYLQAHARPNVMFAKTLEEAGLAESDTESSESEAMSVEWVEE